MSKYISIGNRSKIPAICRAIRLIRKYRGLTQEELSHLLNCHQGRISTNERGSKIPTLEALDLYAMAFNIPVSGIIQLAEYLEGVNNKNQEIQKLIETLEKNKISDID